MRALKCEGPGDDADGQRAGLPGDVGDHRGRAGAGAAAHAAGHEDHVGVLDGLIDVVTALLCGLAANLRVAARAEAARDLVANAKAIGGVRARKGLRVRIHGDVLDTGDGLSRHPGYRVSAAAAHAKRLDTNQPVYIFRQCHIRTPLLHLFSLNPRNFPASFTPPSQAAPR